MGEPKASADDATISEELAELGGTCARGHVEILRTAPEEKISDTPSHEVGHMAMTDQSPNNLNRVWIEVSQRNRLSCDMRFGCRPTLLHGWTVRYQTMKSQQLSALSSQRWL